jgi:hypothetical protein
MEHTEDVLIHGDDDDDDDDTFKVSVAVTMKIHYIE